MYLNSLEVLQPHEPHVEVLVSLTPFLVSSFKRESTKALGPLAFEKFWRSTYHKHPHFSPRYPEQIKLCLRALCDVMGGSLDANLSLDIDVQHRVSKTELEITVADRAGTVKFGCPQLAAVSPDAHKHCRP